MPDTILQDEFDAIFLFDLSFDPAFATVQPETGQSFRDEIRTALENLFLTSATARDIIRDIGALVGENPFPVIFAAGQFASVPNATTFEPLRLELDPAEFRGSAYLDETGTVRAFSLERALIHELIHATRGLHDPDGVTLSKAAPGDTVDLTNAIMLEMGDTAMRLSYGGTIPLSVAGLGTHYSLLSNFDTALVITNGNVDMDGADSVAGTELDLVISYGLHANDIRVGAGRDFVYAGDGNDTVQGGAGNDVLFGEDGDDSLAGGADNDLLNGDSFGVGTGIPGLDTLHGGAGDDLLTSNDGLDTAAYDDGMNGYTITFDRISGDFRIIDRNATLAGNEGRDTLSNVTDLLFSDGITVSLEFDEDGHALRYSSETGFLGWSERLLTFGLDGVRDAMTLTLNNGDITRVGYSNGQKVFQATDDISETKAWAGRTFYWTDTILVREQFLSDTGILRDKEFTDGVLREFTISDLDNAMTWTSHTFTYSATGELEDYTRLDDNGDTSVKKYFDGDAYNRVDTDVSGTEPWAERTWNWHLGGEPDDTRVTYDNGDIAQRFYTNGDLTGISWTDTSDQFNWHIKSRSFAEVFDINTGEPSRVMTQQFFKMDNGNTRTETYRKGALERISLVDVADTFDWQTRSQYYDGPGREIVDMIMDDSADQVTLTYVDDLLTEKRTRDNDDSHSWYSRTDSFDETGAIVNTVFVYDAPVYA